MGHQKLLYFRRAFVIVLLYFPLINEITSLPTESLGTKFGYKALDSDPAQPFTKNPRVSQEALNNNFEDGRLGPWYDDSPGNVNWRIEINNNFEDGRLGPWYDDSPGNVNWRIETYPASFDSLAPFPSSGLRYLRASRFPNRLSGLAVLRSEPFLASPGDKVSFKFWMRSRRLEANNLEVFHRF